MTADAHQITAARCQSTVALRKQVPLPQGRTTKTTCNSCATTRTIEPVVVSLPASGKQGSSFNQHKAHSQQAMRREAHCEDSYAVSAQHNDTTTTTNKTGVLAQKCNIANRRWQDGSPSPPAGYLKSLSNSNGRSSTAHCKSSSERCACHSIRACVGPAIGSINSSTGVLESKLAIVRNREPKKAQLAQRSTVNPRNTETNEKQEEREGKPQEVVSTHNQQETATEQQEQHADNTGTNETPKRQRGEQQQEVAYDA